MAEGDRDGYRREQAALSREREIMKDVKGWEVSWPLWGPYDMPLMMLMDCGLVPIIGFYHWVTRQAKVYTIAQDISPQKSLSFSRPCVNGITSIPNILYM